MGHQAQALDKLQAQQITVLWPSSFIKVKGFQLYCVYVIQYLV